ARRPPDARAAAPPRTPPPRRDPARRRQAARQHPCRWRGAVRRPAPGQTPPSGNARQAQECLQPSKDGARVRAHRDRRPLPGRLCRGPRRRNRRHCDRRPAPGRDLVRRPRHHHPTSLVGQRLALPLTPVARDLHRTRDHALPDPPLPTPDERQDRTLPPHPRRRLGLRPRLHLRDRTTRCPGSMDPRVQPPPPPHRLREQATDHPIDQPVRSVHLGLVTDALAERAEGPDRDVAVRALSCRLGDGPGGGAVARHAAWSFFLPTRLCTAWATAANSSCLRATSSRASVPVASTSRPTSPTSAKWWLALPERPPSSASRPTRSSLRTLVPSLKLRSAKSTHTMFGRVVDS